MQFNIRHLLVATLIVASLIAGVLAYTKWLGFHQIESIEITHVTRPASATLKSGDNGWTIAIDSNARENNIIRFQLSTHASNNNSMSHTFASVLEIHALERNDGFVLSTPIACEIPPSGFAGLRMLPISTTQGSAASADFEATLFYPSGDVVAKRKFSVNIERKAESRENK